MTQNDPYLDLSDANNLSSIQVNIFRVRNTLHNLSSSEGKNS